MYLFWQSVRSFKRALYVIVSRCLSCCCSELCHQHLLLKHDIHRVNISFCCCCCSSCWTCSLHCCYVCYRSIYRLLDSLVVECWLRMREVPGSIPSQGPRHTKDAIEMVPVVPLFSTEHQKGKYWLFLKN